MDANEESHLIEAAKNGDSQAISQLYQAHVQPIYRYILVRVHDPQVAEDLTSDVFVRALETLAHYEQRGLPFLGWLYRIAAGKVVDHFRQVGRRHIQPLDEGMAVEGYTPEQVASQHWQQQQLLMHLDTLTDEQQQVIMLRFVEGHDLKTTACLMGKKEGAIKSLQFRALQALARLLENER
jgi:RNA polymerase sigma-70 factor (ECF subfamily)